MPRMEQGLKLGPEGYRLHLLVTTALYGSLGHLATLAAHNPNRDGPPTGLQLSAWAKVARPIVTFRPGSRWPIRQPDGSRVEA